MRLLAQARLLTAAAPTYVGGGVGQSAVDLASFDRRRPLRNLVFTRPRDALVDEADVPQGPSRAQILIGVAVLAVLLMLGVGAVTVFRDLRGAALSIASRRVGRPVHVDGRLVLVPHLQGLAVRFDQPKASAPRS